MYYLCLEPLSGNVLLCVFDQKAQRVGLLARESMDQKMVAHLYHQTVGTTVPRCHRLCASTIPPRGAKSNSSRLIAIIIQATINPGQAAQGFFSF